jgi:antirestriction protein ArdC
MTLYESVTQTIIEELEHGVAPWVKPWSTTGSPDLPHNAVSRKAYRGVNVLLLWRESALHGYQNPTWLTFKQAKALGGFVRKGEQGTHVVYAATVPQKKVDEQTGEEEEKTISFLKFHTVFNIEQTESLPEHLYRRETPKPFDDAIQHVEVFLKKIGADVRHGGGQAFYEPSDDFIALPHPADFESAGHYYATSIHEHAHWSGHPMRLSRDITGRFGSASYAAEELVAELSAAFLCAYLQIPGRLQHAEYIAAWLDLLRHDMKAIFTASAQATEAAEYLRSLGERSSDASLGRS